MMPRHPRSGGHSRTPAPGERMHAPVPGAGRTERSLNVVQIPLSGSSEPGEHPGGEAGAGRRRD
ncbi:hypothetical protein ASZ90_008942 [hydrocarbon metagenome]|uniref:Uncharacterized protein n=1 Tax=hydrocarbon metagenome TaxID=938273 RepID=A0A0W8FK76_9ZZZZ